MFDNFLATELSYNSPSADIDINVMTTWISLLLTIPPSIITWTDITSSDSDPLNVGDVKPITATVQ